MDEEMRGDVRMSKAEHSRALIPSCLAIMSPCPLCNVLGRRCTSCITSNLIAAVGEIALKRDSNPCS